MGPRRARALLRLLVLAAAVGIVWIAASRLGGDSARGPVAAPPPPREPATLYRDRCLPCHLLGGEGGTYGPDLDLAGRRLTRRAVAAWIRAPSALEPAARMPAVVGLSEVEIDSLAGWIVAVARSRPAGP